MAQGGMFVIIAKTHNMQKCAHSCSQRGESEKRSIGRVNVNTEYKF